MPSVLHPDPFSPILFSSPALVVTEEQKKIARQVLSICASDEQFADKAYRALVLILTGGSVRPPVITSLVPSVAEIGDPSFLMHVHGTGFKSDSVIVFNGGDEVTTFVSATELTTTVNMSTVTIPIAVPVSVRSGNVQSDPMTFTFTDGLPLADSQSDSPLVVKDKVVPEVKKVETITGKETKDVKKN